MFASVTPDTEPGTEVVIFDASKVGMYGRVGRLVKVDRKWAWVDLPTHERLVRVDRQRVFVKEE